MLFECSEFAWKKSLHTIEKILYFSVKSNVDDEKLFVNVTHCGKTEIHFRTVQKNEKFTARKSFSQLNLQ